MPLVLVVFAFALCQVRLAFAQSKTIAIYVEGPDAATARQAVIEALPAGTNVADDAAIRRELVKQGQKRPFGQTVDARAIERVRRAANAIGAGAVLLVRVHKNAPRSALLLVVEASGNVVPDREIHLTLALKEDERNDLRRDLDKYGAERRPSPQPALESAGPAVAPGAPVAPAAAPPPPSPNPLQPVAPEKTEIAARQPAGAETAPPPLARAQPPDARAVMTALADVEVGGGLAVRAFDYRNGIAPRSYTLSGAAVPAVTVSGQLFPLAARGGPWGDIGVVAEASTLLSTSSLVSNPAIYGAGLRVRVHPGPHPPVFLGLSAGYEVAAFGATGPAATQLPGVEYRALRAGVDARFPVGRFALVVGTALRAVVDAGSISDQFYNASGLGFDAHAGAAMMFLPRLEARIAASYRRYSFSFAPPGGANFTSGGAVDQLTAVGLAAAYVY